MHSRVVRERDERAFPAPCCCRRLRVWCWHPTEHNPCPARRSSSCRSIVLLTALPSCLGPRALQRNLWLGLRWSGRKRCRWLQRGPPGSHCRQTATACPTGASRRPPRLDSRRPRRYSRPRGRPCSACSVRTTSQPRSSHWLAIGRVSRSGGRRQSRRLPRASHLCERRPPARACSKAAPRQTPQHDTLRRCLCPQGRHCWFCRRQILHRRRVSDRRQAQGRRARRSSQNSSANLQLLILRRPVVQQPQKAALLTRRPARLPPVRCNRAFGFAFKLRWRKQMRTRRSSGGSASRRSACGGTPTACLRCRCWLSTYQR